MLPLLGSWNQDVSRLCCPWGPFPTMPSFWWLRAVPVLTCKHIIALFSHLCTVIPPTSASLCIWSFMFLRNRETEWGLPHCSVMSTENPLPSKVTAAATVQVLDMSLFSPVRRQTTTPAVGTHDFFLPRRRKEDQKFKASLHYKWDPILKEKEKALSRDSIWWKEGSLNSTTPYSNSIIVRSQLTLNNKLQFILKGNGVSRCKDNKRSHAVTCFCLSRLDTFVPVTVGPATHLKL